MDILATMAYMATIGLPRLSNIPVLAILFLSLPSSIHRIITVKVMVSQFTVLCKSYHSSTSPSVIVENAPLNFVRAGWYRYDLLIYDRGTYSGYWSNIANCSTSSHYFRLGSTDFYPQHSDPKGSGLSVRCVAKNYQFTNIKNVLQS